MDLLHTNQAIRLRPPSVITNNKWLADNFDTRIVYAIPELAVSIIIYCSQPRNSDSLLNVCSNHYKLQSIKIKNLINSLIEKNLLLTSSNQYQKSNYNLFTNQYAAWDQYNWGSAAEYHFYTYDYSFLDYSSGSDGPYNAHKRMVEYSTAQSDKNRAKTYDGDKHKVILPKVFNDKLNNIDESIRINQQNPITCREKLAIILSFAFAKISEGDITWDGLPLIRRTSPSGGSRHPTEGYIFINQINGLECGLYHVQTDPFCLTQLKLNANKQLLQCMFPELYEEQYEPLIIIILSSVFDRNMFRYREPRTFRTIHMDVGHILGTIELITGYVNWKSHVSHNINEKMIEKIIGIDGLEEGVMTSIGIYNFKELSL